MMLERFLREVSHAGLPEGPAAQPMVTDADLMLLPPLVQRYLRFMRVVGRPRDWSMLIGGTGRFRMGPDRPWMTCKTWQYNTSLELARIFHIRMHFGHVVPVLARDTYVRGQGRMVAKALGLVTVADGQGEPYDIGELVTYLNDAILYAPSMLLAPAVSWQSVDEVSFDVALADRGRTVRARVYLDERGAPCDFHTTDRFVEDPFDPQHPLVRARWTTPVDKWELSGPRPYARLGRAVWQLPQGAFFYAELHTDRVTYNVPPGRA